MRTKVTGGRVCRAACREYSDRANAATAPAWIRSKVNLEETRRWQMTTFMKVLREYRRVSSRYGNQHPSIHLGSPETVIFEPESFHMRG